MATVNPTDHDSNSGNPIATPDAEACAGLPAIPTTRSNSSSTTHPPSIRLSSTISVGFPPSVACSSSERKSAQVPRRGFMKGVDRRASITPTTSLKPRADRGHDASAIAIHAAGVGRRGSGKSHSSSPKIKACTGVELTAIDACTSEVPLAQPKRCFFRMIPPDVLISNLFINMTADELLRLALVSHRWSTVVRAPILWRRLYVLDFVGGETAIAANDGINCLTDAVAREGNQGEEQAQEHGGNGQQHGQQQEQQEQQEHERTRQDDERENGPGVQHGRALDLRTDHSVFSPTNVGDLFHAPSSLQYLTAMDLLTAERRSGPAPLSPRSVYSKAAIHRVRRVERRKFRQKTHKEYLREARRHRKFLAALDFLSLRSIYVTAVLALVGSTVLIHLRLEGRGDLESSFLLTFSPVLAWHAYALIPMVLGIFVYLKRNDADSVAFRLWADYRGILRSPFLYFVGNDVTVMLVTWVVFVLNIGTVLMVALKLDHDDWYPWYVALAPAAMQQVTVILVGSVHGCFIDHPSFMGVFLFVAFMGLPFLCLICFLAIYLDEIVEMTLHEVFAPMWALGGCLVVLPLLSCVAGMFSSGDAVEGIALCAFAFGTVIPVLVFFWVVCYYVDGYGADMTIPMMFLPLYIWYFTVATLLCAVAVEVPAPYPAFHVHHPEAAFQRRKWQSCASVHLKKYFTNHRQSSSAAIHPRRGAVLDVGDIGGASPHDLGWLAREAVAPEDPLDSRTATSNGADGDANVHPEPAIDEPALDTDANGLVVDNILASAV